MWHCWPVYREVGAVGKDRHAALRELQLTQMLPLLEGNLHFFSFTKTINYQLELLGKNMVFQEELSSLKGNLSRVLSFRKEASIQKFLNMHSFITKKSVEGRIMTSLKMPMF